MSSIFGILNKQGKGVQPDLIEKIMEAISYWESDDSGTWKSNNIALGCRLLHTTSQSMHEMLPYFHKESDCCITADARIDYREELAEKLGFDRHVVKDLPDSILILSTYLEWGRDCVRHLYGDFAFAIWDGRTDELFCARDHFGCRPFYYFETGDFLAFSSDMKGLMALPGFSSKLDELFIVDSLTTIFPEKDRTAFKDLYRLRPAHRLTINRNGQVKIDKYWDLEIKPEYSRLGEEEAAAGLRDRFREAVRHRCRSAFPVGIELSGGIDTSSIACMAVKLVGKETRLAAFSHTLTEKQKAHYFPFEDEAGYAEIIAGECNIADHFRIDGEKNDGSLTALTDYLSLLPVPVGQMYGIFSDLLYNKAREQGVRVLLSGFGGDEGVTSFAEGFFEELIYLRKFRILIKHLGLKIRLNGIRYGKTIIRLFFAGWFPRVRNIMKIIHSNYDGRRERFKSFAVDPGIVKKYRLRKRYFRKVGLPDDHSVRRRQYKGIMHDQIPDRLEESWFNAQIRKIDYRYPFLDVKLLEFYYSLPSVLKYHHGFGRYIFRRSMEGIITDDICWRDDKTVAIIPNFVYRLIKDIQGYGEIIEEGKRNNSFHYIEYDKLSENLATLIKLNQEKADCNPGTFFNATAVLILQKWQREGRIDIGIMC